MSGEKENKLVSFIMNGRRTMEQEEQPLNDEETREWDGSAAEKISERLDSIEKAISELGSSISVPEPDLEPLESAVRELREKTEADAAEIAAEIRNLKGKETDKQDLTPYMTSREQMKTIIAAVERRDAEITDKAFSRAMEQVATMREDFLKLCLSIRERIDSMGVEDVLSSFEAYMIDLENILCDGGVYIGPFPYEKLKTSHQRIVVVIPTADHNKNGMVAERMTDGYKLGNKVLIKEKVTVYRLSESMMNAEKPGPEPEAAIETTSETASEEETKQEEIE